MPDSEDQKKLSKSIKQWLKRSKPITEEENARSSLTGASTREDESQAEETVSAARKEISSTQEKTSGFLGVPNRLLDIHELPIAKLGMHGTSSADLQDDQVNLRLEGQVQPETPPESKVGKWLRKRSIHPPGEAAEPREQKTEETILGAVAETEKIIVESDLQTLRTTAIEGYEPTQPEDSGKTHGAFIRIKQWFEELTSFWKIAVIAGAVAIIGVLAIGIIFIIARPLTPIPSQATVAYISAVPIPAVLYLPGGETVNLSVGILKDGAWEPKRAEWLAGTEVPRWLTIPWNKKLAAAVQDYKANDLIQLQMSNADMLVYRFLDVEELPVGGMSSFHANSTDLLILLSNPGSKSQSVIVAEP